MFILLSSDILERVKAELKAFNAMEVPGKIRIQATLRNQLPLLHFSFELSGDLSHLSLDSPEPGTAHFSDRLWQRSCFELFIKSPENSEYWEWNFSPSLNWGFFKLSDYREGLSLDLRDAGIQHLEVFRSRPDRLQISGTLLPNFSAQLSWLRANRQPLLVNISTVLLDKNEKLHYFALSHPREKPDFHDPRAFIEFI